MVFQSNQPDKIALLYPNVNEVETVLPRSWSPKDKFSLIGLSQNNLRVHYKGNYYEILIYLYLMYFKYMLKQKCVVSGHYRQCFRKHLLWFELE